MGSHGQFHAVSAAQKANKTDVTIDDEQYGLDDKERERTPSPTENAASQGNHLPFWKLLGLMVAYDTHKASQPQPPIGWCRGEQC